ncbi:15941_t:CDS:2 [Entrophospora sp. SA101]|nr:15941_t:CDS:2 [Entrophospora sp. SA101]
MEVAIVLSDKYKKVVIARNFDGGTKEHPYGHAIVVEIERYPLKVIKQEKFSTFRNVTEEAKKKDNKGEFFVNVGDSLCSNCYNCVVQYDRNQKYNKKNDNKPFKRHKSTENIATDNNNSLASIEELQNEITKLKKEIEALTMYSINEMAGK